MVNISDLPIRKWSTWQFIGIVIATCGLFYYIWLWRFFNKTSSEARKSSNLLLVIITFVLIGWGSDFSGYFNPLNEQDTAMMVFLGNCMRFAGTVLVIVLSFLGRKDFEDILAANGHPVRMNSILLFVIPFIYQYYLAYSISLRSTPPSPGPNLEKN